MLICVLMTHFVFRSGIFLILAIVFGMNFITVCYGLIFNMIGYYYWGLIGLGISSFIKYGFYFFAAMDHFVE